MKIAIVDADSICYLLNHKLTKLSEITPITTSKVRNAVNLFTDKFVENIAGLTNIEWHFTHSAKNTEIFKKAYKRTPEEQFRKTLGIAYKNNRPQTEMRYYTEVLTELLKIGNCFIHDKWEADDAVVFRSKQQKNTVICANDKDVLKQAAGRHFAYDSRMGWIETSPVEANNFRFMQAMAGDATDGYYGIPKIGLKTAAKYLTGASSNEERWKRVEAAYIKAGLTKEDAIRQMRMADMHQINAEGELSLFNPSSITHPYQTYLCER